MTATSKRHQTMAALMKGSRHYSHSAEFAAVVAELEELGRCGRLQPEKRKRLLQVIHSTRALDTALGALIAGNGISPLPYSIGPRLTRLAGLPVGSHGHLPQSAANSFKFRVCSKRNVYAHEANRFPSSTLAAHYGQRSGGGRVVDEALTLTGSVHELSKRGGAKNSHGTQVVAYRKINLAAHFP